MASFVDDRYKIHIYLDTNILVDYVEQNNSILNCSLDFLSTTPFAILRSSHYVEYEMTEVRKKRLFYYKVYGHYPSKGESLANIKQTWELNGHKYEEYRDEIAQEVVSNMELIEENLGVRFDDHVLHDKLISPTRDMCLATKVSREDCMVMVSCMFPSQDERLDFCALLSNDKQYIAAIKDNEDKVLSVFKQYGINPPYCLNAKALDNGNTLLNVEDANNRTPQDIANFWGQLLLLLIRKKHEQNYLGHTIKPGKSKASSSLVFVDIEDPKKELIDSENLVIVSHDLSCTIEIGKDFDYWDNDSAVQLPHKNERDTKYSFRPNIDKVILSLIQQKGNLIFYTF